MANFTLHDRSEDKKLDDLKLLQSIVETLSPEEQQQLQKIAKNLVDNGTNPEKEWAESVLFKQRPPTPEEFLDPKAGWLDSHYVQSIREWVREDFLKVADTSKMYNVISFYGATRCEHEDTEVLMWDLSTRKMKDLRIGDLLMGPDSSPRLVERMQKGEDELYKVHQNKGADDYIVTKDHILVLEYTNWNNHRTGEKARKAETRLCLSVEEYLQKSKTEKHKLKGIRTPHLEFEETPLDIDPYYVGLWLGDGSAHTAAITTIDPEILEYLSSYIANFPEDKVHISSKQGTEAKTVAYSDRERPYRGSFVFRKFKEWGLLNNKHVPVQYLRNSKENRLRLLAGILDSDGHLEKRGGTSYDLSCKSERLAKDILFLCRSLGLRASIVLSSKSIKSINFTGLYYRLCITGNLSSIPCRLPRKQAWQFPKGKSVLSFHRTGISVSPYGHGKYVGITVAGPDSYYLHSDLTIAKNCGKSFLANLLMLYTIVYLHHLRDVNASYSMSPNTSLCMYILSYNYKKVYEIYLKPLYNIMDRSERFRKVKFQDSVQTEQVKVGNDIIVYSKAALVGHLTLNSGIQLITGNSDTLAILGANILSAYISEIAFFIENAGATEEAIFQLYTDVRERIKATVGNKAPLAFTYLDTSANNVESRIESEILKKLRYDTDNVFFHWLRRWDVKELHAKNFPIWVRTGQTFPVCTGDGTHPPKILQDFEVSEYPSDLIDYPPIDALPDYERNLVKSIKDIGGKPSSNESKFIQNVKVIDSLFDNGRLQNVISLVTADAGQSPEMLIWNNIQHLFFHKTFDGRFSLMRAPREMRMLGFDLAKSNKGDLAGIAMCHKEWSNELRSVVIVYDFAFAVGFGEVGINLQAVEEFVMDLMREGTVPIKRGYIDTALSSQLQQNLNRRVSRDEPFIMSNSVDRDMNDYQNLLSALVTGTVKAGKNIFLKNNLMCLERVTGANGKEKVDHPSGKHTYIYDGDWEKSEAGKNMKDVSDAMAQAYSAMKSVDLLPSTIYEEENSKLIPDTERREKDVKKAFTLIGKL
jgi:hypothetical protein